MKLGSVIALSVLLLALYLIYTGAVNVVDVVLGVIVAAAVSALFADVVIENPGKIVDVKRWAYLLAYAILYLTVIEAKAHWGVVKVILHPRVPVRPAIVRIRHDVETDYAKTLIANSITNTPGTVTVDVDEERRVMYIHWISAETLDDEGARRRISELFERYAKKIFE